METDIIVFLSIKSQFVLHFFSVISTYAKTRQILRELCHQEDRYLSYRYKYSQRKLSFREQVC